MGTEEAYKTLFEAANDANFIMSDELFIECNSKALIILACEKEQIIGKTPYYFSPKFQPDGTLSEMASKEKINKAFQGYPQFFEWTHSRFDGSVFDAEVTLNKIIVDKKAYLQAIVKDISERKKVELALQKSEEKYRIFFEQAADGIFQINTNGKIIGVNNSASEITAYSKEELLKMKISELFTEEELNRTPLRDNLLKKGHIITAERTITRKDGSSCEVEMHTKILPDNTYQAIARDITKRKKAENELIESEERYSNLIQIIPTGVIIHSNGKVVFSNVAASKIMEAPSDINVLGLNIIEFVHPEYRDIVFQRIKESLTENKSAELIEEVFLTFSGKKIFVEVSNLPIVYKGVPSVLVVFNDITERKQTDTLLKESEAKYRTIFENTGTATLIIEEDTTISLINSKFEELSGLTKEQIEHKRKWTEFVVPEDLEKMLEMHKLRRIDPLKALRTYEFRFKEDKGNIRNVLLYIDIIPGSKKSLASCLDITEIKKATEEIVENERQFRNIIELANISLSIVDFDGTIEYINKQAIKTFGYEHKDIPNMDRWWNLAYPDKKYRKEVFDQWMGLIDEAIKGNKEIKRSEYRVSCKDGSVKTMIIFGVIVNDKVLCLFEDITERKNAEDELLRNRMLLRSMIDSLPIWISATDTEGNYLIANDYYAKTFKVPLELIEQHNFKEFFPDTLYKRHKVLFDECLKIGKVVEVNDHFEFEKGKKTYFYGSYIPLYDSAGNIFGLSAAVFDISKQKNAETLLKESEATYRTIFENTGTATIIIEEDTTISLANTKCAELLGLPKEEIENKKSWREFVVIEDLEKMTKMHGLRRTDPSKALRYYEFSLKDAKGDIKNILLFIDTIPGTAKSIASLLDITEQKKSGEALAKSNSLLRATLESTADGILVVDINGVISGYNKQFQTIWEIPDDIMTSGNDNNAIKFVLSKLKDPKRFLKKVKELYSDKEANSLDIIEFIDGRTFERFSQPQQIEGKVVGRVWSFRDISERKRATEELKESEKQFRTTFENAPIGMSLNHINGQFFQANESFCKMLGYTQKELPKLNFVNITHPDDIDASKIFIQEKLSDKSKSLHIEKRYVKKDGSFIWAITSVSVIKDVNNTPKYFIVQVLDITEQKQIEQDLKEAKEQLEIIFDNGPDAILLTRIEDGLFIDSNKTFTKYTGFTPDDLRGKTTIDIDIWENPKEREFLLQEIQTNGYCHNLEIIVKNKDGISRTIDLSAEIIYLKGIPHLLSMCRDMSERKHFEDLLKKKNEKLCELVATKDRFFSIIAHDLKDPFNAILGFSEILSESYNSLPDSDRKTYIKNIQLSSESLSRLLQNLLEWAGSQTGKMIYKPEKIDLDKIVNETIELIQYQAKIKQIRLISDLNSSLNVYADVNMVKTILRNLVSNAIKFTHRNGFVKITSMNVTDRKNNNKFVEISVIDNGIGIKKESLANIFNLDQIIKTQKGTENETGSGLGLILCKELIEKNKGYINIKSEEGAGSTFSFTLPKKIID